MQPRIHAAHAGILRAHVPAGADFLWVDLPRQRLGGWIQEEALVPVPVSTGRSGLGNQPDSGASPLGWHRVQSVIGTGAQTGQRFVSREPLGKPLSMSDWQEGAEDFILTRILWLQGLIPGLNGHSGPRYIYLHGTNQEKHLGRPVSGGCIRVANAVIAEWADRIGNRECRVWIGSLDRL